MNISIRPIVSYSNNLTGDSVTGTKHNLETSGNFYLCGIHRGNTKRIPVMNTMVVNFSHG